MTPGRVRIRDCMLFPTVQFAVFFIVVFTVNWLLRPFFTPWRIFLVVASFAFYLGLTAAEIYPLGTLLAGSIVLNWMIGHAVVAARAGSDGPTDASRWVVRGGVVANLAILGWFKYAGFMVVDVANGWLFFDIDPQLVEGIILPVGISFFTFHALSYIDRPGAGHHPRADDAARLRPLHVVLPAPGGRPDRAGRRVRPPDLLAPRPAAHQLGAGLPPHRHRHVQEGRGLELRGRRDRRPGVRRPLRALGVGGALGHPRLRRADLRRLQRLHRHRHRVRPAARLPLPPELRRPLHGALDAGLLAPVAHDPVALAA